MLIRNPYAALALLAAVLVLMVGGMPALRGGDAPPAAASADASGAEAGGTAPPESKNISLWSTIKDGGIIGFLIIIMSMVSIALVVEHFLAIRADRLVPAGLEEKLQKLLDAKKYGEAQKLCAEDGSFLAAVINAGLGQVGGMFGFFDMQNAMQEVSERQVSKLYRKLEYLTFIASTAPMVGLLGTVTGMIAAFNEIAASSGSADPSQLAGGISQALVTTCLGLSVAIPTMFFVSFFRNRIDAFVAEAESTVEKLMGRFRRETA